MKEIKFRAWDNRYGQYCDVYILKPFDNTVETSYGVRAVGIDIILEQFTGLHDKNGKEDFESDVVKVRLSGYQYYREIYKAESGAWVIDLPDINSNSESIPVMLYSIEHENTGNIHENPKLLEEGIKTGDTK